MALTGAPSVSATLSGWACYDQAQTECTNVASTTDPNALQIQSDLAAQIAKWKNDLQPLQTYPIVSFGVAYSFPGSWWRRSAVGPAARLLGTILSIGTIFRAPSFRLSPGSP